MRLKVSYCLDPRSTVPRQGLCQSFELSCDRYGVEPINSASFGKAVRSAFPGIITRRLGPRGNRLVSSYESKLIIHSKYHYVGIRPALPVEAERLNAFGDSSG
jgi:hypothetical protein